MLTASIVVGSRNLSHFDAALVAYTFAVLFATFGLTYRYSMWLQRPPTAMYWRRGWRAFFRKGFRSRNAGRWFDYTIRDFALNTFIWSRDRLRGLTHLLLMWGCLLAVAITFPLVFGWIHFQSVAGDLETYRVVVFGFPAFTFPTASLTAFLLFHGLVWSAFMVIAGVMLAVRRRMRDEGAAALQAFSEDFLPLVLLFAVSISGLMLTASYTWMKGYAYDFLAIFHAITVIFTFLWLPFGKFFHIFQRPAQIGVRFYKDVGEREASAQCRRCGEAFTSQMHVEDLIEVTKALGYRYDLPGSEVEHYQWVCPACRRGALAVAQGKLRNASPAADDELPRGPMPRPIHANRGIGEGPLGEEDFKRFHP